MGIMLVASLIETKEMILTHGECERLSIFLGVVVGMVCTGKRKKTGRAFEKSADIYLGPHLR